MLDFCDTCIFCNAIFAFCITISSSLLCRSLKREAARYSKVQPSTGGAQLETGKYKVVKDTGPIKPTSTHIKIGFVIQDSIPHGLLDALLKSTHMLCSLGPLLKEHSSNRGIGKTLHMGFWRRYSTSLYESADFKNHWSKWWATFNEPVWKLASELLRKHFPTVYKILDKVRTPYKFGSWHMAALNVNVAVTPHADKEDHLEGICCVIALGDFDGGELCFPSKLVCVKMRHGTIVLFHSAQYEHVVSRFIGTRFSIVLFSDENVIKNHIR